MGSINKQVARYEITAVFTHPDASVDIVLVHGLNGHPKSTWTSPSPSSQHEDGVFWPTDLLPQSLGKTRANILVYGYNADVYTTSKSHASASASDNFIYQHAQTLVTNLALYRKSEHTDKNPIIFVAHSLGGILVKRALMYSNDLRDKNQEDARSIFVSTFGIIFLGTPHTGSGMATWGVVLQNIADAIAPKKMFESESVLLKTLKKDNETLQNINSHFLDFYQRFKIHMAHENHKTDIKGTTMTVVDASSASPQLPGVVYYGIEAPHSGMCKFNSSSAPGYRNVSTAIRTWAEEAPPVIRTRWDIELDDRKARAQSEAAEITREYNSPSETVISEYRYLPAAQQSSPVDTTSTRCASVSDSAPQVLNNSGPHHVHPDRFRPNSFFKGREDYLADLHKLLKDPKRRSQGTSAVLIHGIPGVGKTHLAREYYFNHKDQYSGGVYWIRSTTLQDMEDGFWRIAKTQAIKGMAAQGYKNDLLNPHNMVDIVRRWFNESSDWLLVFDGIRVNDKAILRYIPDRPNSSLIYTSTDRCDPGSHLLDNPSMMKLPLPPIQDAQELLLEEMGKKQPYNTDDLRRAHELVQLMGRLPLMIHAAAVNMNTTREPLAKYLKTFRDSPKVGELPAYMAIRDQLQTRGNHAALNLIYILSFFSQFIPVELLALGLGALDKRTPVKTETSKGRRSLTQTFVTLISFALIERNESDDVSSSSSQSGLDAAPEPLDTLRVHSIVQAFFIEHLAKEGQLHFWLERAIRVFCASFDEAYTRINDEPATGLPEDYRQYIRHGRRLKDLVDRHAVDRPTHQATEQPSSQTGPVDLVAARRDLEERLAKVPADLNDLQRTVSTRIIDGKEAAHNSVFERMNSLSSHSTDASGAAVLPQSPGVYSLELEQEYILPRPMDNPVHFHMPYVPYVDEQASSIEYQGSEDRTITPYPPDIEEGPYEDTADVPWTVVTKHRSVKKRSLRRYHDRGGAWRETAAAINDPRVSISRESARGLITPPQSSRGGRSPSHSKVSARSEAEAELLHIKKGSPPPPRGGGHIHDKGRSSSAGTSVRPISMLGASSYAKAVSGTAVEEETPSFPTFASPPSRAATIDRTAAYDDRSVYSLQTVNSRTPSAALRLKENQFPKSTGSGNVSQPTEPSRQSQGQEPTSKPSFQSFFKRLGKAASGNKRHEKSVQGKVSSSGSSISSAPRSSEELPYTYQEDMRTANSSPGPAYPPQFPSGLSVVTNQQSSLRQHPLDRQSNSQPPYTYQEESYDDVLSQSDPCLGRPSLNVFPAENVGYPPPLRPVPSSTYRDNYRSGSPMNPPPPNGYSSQPMSRNPSSNPRYATATGSAGTPLSSNSGSVRSSLPHRRAPSMVETEPSPRLSPIEMDQVSYDMWAIRQRGGPIDEALFGGSNMPRRLPVGRVPSFIRESPTMSPRTFSGGSEPMSRSGSGGIRTTDGRLISFGDIPVNVEEAERRRVQAEHDRLQRRYEEAVELSQRVRTGEADLESPPESSPIGLGLRMP